MDIKVSILVPVYNVEDFLRECLDSLVSQTLTDIEIICINDGSTDDSLSILKEYANMDPRIKVISKHNTGYGNTMNIGLEYAKGEYIGIVESDDFISSNMYEVLYFKAKKNALDFVKSNYYKYETNGKIEKDSSLSIVGYDFIMDPKKYNIFDILCIAHWSGLYNREFLIKNNVKFSETPGASYQDVSFLYLVYLYAKRVMFIEDAFLYYRIDNVNSSVKSKEKVFYIIKEFQRIWDCYEKENEVNLLKRMCPLKFKHFMGHLSRMDCLYQYAFLIKIRDFIMEDKQKGLLVPNYWNEECWNDMNLLIDDLDKFFKTHCSDYINRYSIADFVQNETIKQEAICNYIKNSKKVCIYGAGVYARSIVQELSNLHSIDFFVVGEEKDVGKQIDNIPVKALSEVRPSDDLLVVVALKKSVQSEVVKYLYSEGYKNLLVVNGKSLQNM